MPISMPGMTIFGGGGNDSKGIRDFLKTKMDSLQIKQFVAQDDHAAIYFDNNDQLWISKEDKDGSVWSTIINDPRSSYCAFCNHGWENTIASITDSIQLGQSPILQNGNRKNFAHRSCWMGYLARTEFDEFSKALQSAGLIYDNLTETPNGYGCAWNTPWYKARLIGTFKLNNDHHKLVSPIPIPIPIHIGWRKRVVSVTVSLSTRIEIREERKKLALLVDDVTKEFGDQHWSTKDPVPDTIEKSILFHAWGYEKLAEYLNDLSLLILDQKDWLEETK